MLKDKKLKDRAGTWVTRLECFEWWPSKNTVQNETYYPNI